MYFKKMGMHKKEAPKAGGVGIHTANFAPVSHAA
jgi:hypothetical protein